MSDSRRELLLLPVLALIGALVLAGIYIVVAPRIADNKTHANDRIVLDAMALPAATTLSAHGTLDDGKLLALRAPRTVYLARQNQRLVAIVLPVSAPDGYVGAIDLIAGIAPDGKIINVHAIAHRETTGLGDRIDSDKSAWIKQFIGRSLESTPAEQWNTKNAGGDFDQITGATVTSRAVIDAVHNALLYFELHREQLLQDEYLLPDEQPKREASHE